MDSTTSIRKRNEHTRELIAEDLAALADRLDVGKQAASLGDTIKDKTIHKVQGALGMGHHNNGAHRDHADHGVGTVLMENKLALLALAWGAKSLIGSVRQHRDAGTGAQTATSARANVAAPNLGDDATLDADGGIGRKASEAVSTAQHKVEDAKTTVVETTGQLRSRADDLTTAAQVRALDAQEALASAKDTVVAHVPTSVDEVSRIVRQNPALVGAGAFAAGALIGAFIPRTSMEKERVAEVQDVVVDKAQEAVQTGVEKARGAVEKGVEAARDELAPDDSTAEPEDGGSVVTTPNRITGSRSSSSQGAGASREGLNSTEGSMLH